VPQLGVAAADARSVRRTVHGVRSLADRASGLCPLFGGVPRSHSPCERPAPVRAVPPGRRYLASNGSEARERGVARTEGPRPRTAMGSELARWTGVQDSRGGVGESEECDQPLGRAIERQDSAVGRLTCACSRRAGAAPTSAWAGPSASAPRNEGLCGRPHDGPQLMRQSLGSRGGDPYRK
jgi:hypothetical protein